MPDPSPKPVRSRARRVLRFTVMMLLANLVMFGLLELGLWVLALTTGLEARVPPPLPAVEVKKALCPARGGEGVRLCAADGEGGARAWDVPFSKVPGKPRIIVIGESFVHGFRLARDEAWPARLEKHLGGKFEVLNFGVCGSEIAGLEPVIKAASGLQPRLIVMAIGNNEYTMAPYYGGLVGRYPALFYDAGEVMSASRVYGALRRWVLPGIYGFLPAGVPAESGRGVGPMQKYVDALHGRPPRNLHLFPDMVADPDVTAFLEGTKRLNERWFRTRYRQQVRRLVADKVPLALATLPRQLDVPPILTGLNRGTRQALGPLMGKLLDPGPTEVDPRFQARLVQALEEDPYLAAALYVRGRALLREGKREEGIRYFRRAAQWDLVPDVTPRINATIRDTAEDTGAPLIDLARLTEAWLGKEKRYYYDPIHLSADGADALAKMVAGEVRKLENRE